MYSDDEDGEMEGAVPPPLDQTNDTKKQAKSERLIDSSDEDEIDESLPNYCEELFRFKQETKKKIEEFKDARSKYIFEENFHPSTSNRIHEGESDSEVYNGRCYLLRKMRFKTGRLRSHYKSLRPFKNYTLNRQISSSDAPPDDKDDREILENNIPVFPLDNSKTKESQPKVFASMVSNIDIPRAEGINLPPPAVKKKKCRRKKKSGQKKEKLSLQKTQNNENVEGPKTASEMKLFTKELRKKKKRERKLSLRVLDNLNIDKPGYKYLEPCLCDNGKEVTVVIKGFCLCKKMKQGKHRFQRVCEQYGGPYVVPCPSAAQEPPRNERRLSDKRRISIADGEPVPVFQPSEGKLEARRRSAIEEDQKPRTPEEGKTDQKEAGPPAVKILDPENTFKTKVRQEDEQVPPIETDPENTFKTKVWQKDEQVPSIKTDTETENSGQDSTVKDKENRSELAEEDKEKKEPALAKENGKGKVQGAFSKESEKERVQWAPLKENEKERVQGAYSKEGEKERVQRSPPKENEKERVHRVPSTETEKERVHRVSSNETDKTGKESVAKEKRKQEAASKEHSHKVDLKEKKRTKEELDDDGKSTSLNPKELKLGDKRHSGSLRTIFENKTSKRSKMALTKEQLEKMSKIHKTR